MALLPHMLKTRERADLAKIVFGADREPLRSSIHLKLILVDTIATSNRAEMPGQMESSTGHCCSGQIVIEVRGILLMFFISIAFTAIGSTCVRRCLLNLAVLTPHSLSCGRRGRARLCADIPLPHLFPICSTHICAGIIPFHWRVQKALLFEVPPYASHSCNSSFVGEQQDLFVHTRSSDDESSATRIPVPTLFFAVCDASPGKNPISFCFRSKIWQATADDQCLPIRRIA